MERNIVTRFLLIIFCTVYSTWQYIVLSLATCEGCLTRIAEIANGTSVAPFAYRILVPKFLVLMGNKAEGLILFQAIMFVFFYILLWEWAKKLNISPLWVVPVFTLITSIMMPTYYFSVYTLPEWNFLLWILLLLPPWSQSAREISSMRFILIAVLVAIGTLNREMTGILIWLLVFAAYPKRWQWWLPLGILVTVILVGLRIFLSAGDSSYSASYVLGLNLVKWRREALTVYGLLLVPMLIMFFRHIFHSTRELYLMIAVVLIPYSILVILLGSWSEVRLWMPLFIVGLPLIKLNR